jgi:hypothetical protein
MGRRITPLRKIGPGKVNKVSGGIASTTTPGLVPLLYVDTMGKAAAAATSPASKESSAVGIDALRVLALVKAIESRGEGFNLGQWCEMVMGWDASRVFEAIHHAVGEGWIEASGDQKGRVSR